MTLFERVGTAQRTYALELLGKALAEGYLELPEYEERITLVHSARTAGDLIRALADLPPPLRWDPRGHHNESGPLPVPSGVPAGASTGDTPVSRAMSALALSLGILSIPMALCVGIGLVCGAAAVILGLLGRRGKTADPIAVSGIVLGILGIVFSAGALVFLIPGLTSSDT